MDAGEQAATVIGAAEAYGVGFQAVAEARRRAAADRERGDWREAPVPHPVRTELVRRGSFADYERQFREASEDA